MVLWPSEDRFPVWLQKANAGSERASPHLMVYNDIPGVGLPFKQHERAKSSSEHESCTCTY